MTRRVKSRRTVEHTWTCSACKSLNRGRDLMCPKCGKTKTDEAYDTSSKATVVDPKLIAIAHGGPNWDCMFCRFENRAADTKCKQCGAEQSQLAEALQNAHVAMSRTAGSAADALATQLEIFSDFKAATADAAGTSRIDYTELQGHLDRARMPTAVFPPPPDPPRTPAASGGYRDAAVSRLDDAAPPITMEPEPIEWKTTPLPWYQRAAIWLTDESRKWIVQGLAVTAIITLLTGFGIWLFSPWHEHVRVSSATWARQCDLHHRVTLRGEGWGSPPGAFNTSCESRQHGTHNCNAYDCHPHDVDCRCHQVEDGESCTESCTSGENGFSDCEEVCETEYTEECDTCTEYDTCYEQCPTYDDWCRYSYYEWPIVATTRAAGTDHDPVVWPEMTTPNDGETYRIEQAEEYHVAFTNENGTWAIDPSSEAAFERYHAGARWDIEVTHAGTVSPVGPEQHP